MGMGQFTVKVNGADLGPGFSGALTDVLVESTIHEPDLIELRFTDLDFAQVDGSQLQSGGAIEVLVKTDDTAATTLAKGEITATELRFEAEKILMLVRGMDKGHRLMRGRKTKNRVNVTISDVVGELAGGAGLLQEIDATSVVYPFILQDNVADAQHMRHLALLAGASVTVLDNKLKFKVAPEVAAEVLTLKLHENLHELKATMSSADLVDQVEVRGWDPWQKAAIVGTAGASKGSKASKIAGVPVGGASLKSNFGAAKMVVSSVVVPNQGAAAALATSVMGILTSSAAEMEAVCDGSSKLIAGATIKVDGCGRKLSGTHVITSARHVWNAIDNYRTVVTVSGRQNRGLLGSILGGPGRGQGQHYGVVSGIVTANKGTDDPSKGSAWGWVKVKFPWMDETTESAWARVASPMAGPERGLFLLPEVNDEVVVGFDHGDMNHPVVLGSLWNGKDKPPLADKIVAGDGKVTKRQFKTRGGATLTFTEQEDAKGETFSIVNKSTKMSFLIDSKTKKIVLTALENGTIEITADSDIKVTSNLGMLTLAAQKDVSIESKTGKVALKGMADVTMTSQTGGLKGTASVGPVEFSGLTAKLAGATNATLDGGPQAAVKAAMVKLGP